MGKTKGKGQSGKQDLTPFLGALQVVQDLLNCFGERGVVIGGIAVSILGKPRLTADVDAVFLLDIEDIPRLLKEAAARGLEPRIADAEVFARHNRVILLRHSASGVAIDISLGMLPFESEMVDRSRRVTIGDLEVRLPTPEDLIILKAVAHRPQDLLDIDTVVECHPDLDKERIRYWVRQFAETLGLPELLSDLEARLK
jgi:predicted nucleotidyltransferase